MTTTTTASPPRMSASGLMGPASGIVLLAVVAAAPVAGLWRRFGPPRSAAAVPGKPAVAVPSPPVTPAALTTSDGFVRWLETGARAGSDPSRFLATERPVSSG